MSFTLTIFKQSSKCTGPELEIYFNVQYCFFFSDISYAIFVTNLSNIIISPYLCSKSTCCRFISYTFFLFQLESVCGSPAYKQSQFHRLKIWEKPTHTSYDGDFSGDLRKLYQTLDEMFKGFYEHLPTRICESEPDDSCWDGLTER